MGAETLTDMQTIQQVQQNVTDYFKGNAVKNVYLSGSCVHGGEDKCRLSAYMQPFLAVKTLLDYVK